LLVILTSAAVGVVSQQRSVRSSYTTQATLNDTIKAKKTLLKQGKITIEQYMGHAIYWACKSTCKKLQLAEGQTPIYEIDALEESISNNSD
jgi:hypothetical protein